MTRIPRVGWYCPLYGMEIAEGKCLDINYERLGYMVGECLDEVVRITGKDESEIANTCKVCPNLPIDDNLGIVSFPRADATPDELTSADASSGELDEPDESQP
jgi:hypothetical protein